jgi:hypothetical protein
MVGCDGDYVLLRLWLLMVLYVCLVFSGEGRKMMNDTDFWDFFS